MVQTPVVGRISMILPILACLLAPQAFWFLGDRPADQEGNRFRKTCEAVAAIPRNRGSAKFFVDITDEVGLDFQHVVGPLGTYFMPEVNGAGGALFDYDNDGDLDLYLINGGRSPKAVGEFPPGTRVENRLFRQEPDGRFVDVTGNSGLGDTGFGVGCAVGDIDNDGDLDVYVTNYGPDRMFRNNGAGTFSDITDVAGISNPDWASGATFFDYDRDGRLDLFVTNYVSDPIYGHSVACDFDEHGFNYCGPLKFAATVDRLFHNEGIRTDESGSSSVVFVDVTARAGMSDTKGAGFTAVCADFNRDGWPDIYVTNDLYPNRLWINGVDGTFSEQGQLRGAAVNGDGIAEAGMGIAIGDVNSDASFDLLATHFSRETSTLYVNDGNGIFSDVTLESKLAGLTLQHTGWGAALLDLDHDGDLDLPLANGLVTPCELIVPIDRRQRLEVRQDDIPDAEDFWNEFADRNLLLVNDGNGRFDDGSQQGGDFTAYPGSARALIFGDIDEDGDPDLLVTYCGGRARLFRNDVPKRGHWLKVRAVDPRLHRDAYGAEVTVIVGDRRLLRTVNPSSSYLASNDPRPHFGLGASAGYDAIHVVWPDGLAEVFPDGPADEVVVLRRGEGRRQQEYEE